MPDGNLKDLTGVSASDVLRSPAHYGPYEVLRVGRDNDLVQARKYRALAETGTSNASWLNQLADIHQRSADEYTAILNERGLQ